jgi:hypothetical protein
MYCVMCGLQHTCNCGNQWMVQKDNMASNACKQACFTLHGCYTVVCVPRNPTRLTCASASTSA